MKTEKEIDTVKRIYDTADILCELFKKYQNYDNEEKNIYDINEVFQSVLSYSERHKKQEKVRI